MSSWCVSCHLCAIDGDGQEPVPQGDRGEEDDVVCGASQGGEEQRPQPPPHSHHHHLRQSVGPQQAQELLSLENRLANYYYSGMNILQKIQKNRGFG